MNNYPIVTAYTALTKEQKLRVLLRVSGELTIIARTAHFQGVIEKPERIIAANEVQHRIIDMMLRLVEKDTVWTDEEIVEYVLVGLADKGDRKALERAIEKVRDGQDGVAL